MNLHHDAAQFSPAVRRDGWTPERKARFLSYLSEKGNVRAAAARCGMSAQSAYVQRRRDPLFARTWDAALLRAHEAYEQVLAERAIEGVEEPIYYRGELVGTRRRYDSRLLLAHLARLDRQIGTMHGPGYEDRFDEMLAVVAGAEFPPVLADEDVLPLSCVAFAARVAKDAERAAAQVLPRKRSAVAEAERRKQIAEAGDVAYLAAEAEWSKWYDHACSVVDRLIEGGPEAAGEAASSGLGAAAQFPLRTVSLASTSGHCRSPGEESALGPAMADLGEDDDAAREVAELRQVPAQRVELAALEGAHGVLRACEPGFGDAVEGEARQRIVDRAVVDIADLAAERAEGVAGDLGVRTGPALAEGFAAHLGAAGEKAEDGGLAQRSVADDLLGAVVGEIGCQHVEDA